MLTGLKNENQEEGKTQHFKMSRSKNHKATQNTNNTSTIALERSVSPGGLKYLYSLQIFSFGPDVILNINT